MEFSYYGKKEKVGPCQVIVKEKHSNSALTTNHILRHIERHSPDGFQWGYAGSGPSDLALAILTDYCGRFKIEDTEIPNKYYQRFKDNFISNAKEELNITSMQIEKWLENMQKKIVSIVEKHKEFISVVEPIVAEHVDKLDPIGLLDAGMPENVYASEIRDIVIRLKMTEYDFLSLSEMMYVIFAYAYELKTAKPESKYLLPAQQIIKQIQEQKYEK